ncbi:MAG: hypothetical protein D6820_13060, partial [Lentisphaerae bacterium]
MTKHVWNFPLPRTHTGVLMGNATTGLMIWGEENCLKITFGRADFWDHRGGMRWTERQSYRNIRRCLENHDEPGIRELFAAGVEGGPARPTVVPFGRIELELAEGFRLLRAIPHFQEGYVSVWYTTGAQEVALEIDLGMTQQTGCIAFPQRDHCRQIRAIPAWQLIPEQFRNRGIAEPEMVQTDEELQWFQSLPSDPGLGYLFFWDGGRLWFGNERGGTLEETMRCLRHKLTEAARDVEGFRRSIRQWWEQFWDDVPQVSLPNQRLQFLYDYGMYKLAGFSQPGGVPATLQGPWIEEYQMPPWSSDYHFNINVQMCYWPVFRANRLSHLRHLFDMIFSWLPVLRHNARCFLGIDDGVMLPHAVDDRCTCMGNFWTGSIDHGCAAWVAQMMFQYVLYTGDRQYLQEHVYDFMKGTMKVYEGMLEKDGDQYRLPVSVSPEYRGASMNAWGANASFQLACIHRLVEDLIHAASLLNEQPEPQWLDIREKLPKASLFGSGNQRMIGLWDGLVLEESHRHHSHLAGICPFDVIDPYDPQWSPIVEQSLRHWVAKGMGRWSGWCVPWASMIHSRVGNGKMAELLLEIWDRVFTNCGHGTLHDCDFPGFTLMGSPNFLDSERRRSEIMQMDAGMGAVTAIQEMLLHSRRGVCHIFHGVPEPWRDVRFDFMPTEFGCRIRAVKEKGVVRSVEI